MSRIAGYIVGGIILGAPLTVFGSVTISEIMYDLAEGSDSGREWIELYNEGSAAVSLSGWKLFEAQVNHGVATTSGQSFDLPAGSFAVIADNPQKFLVDWPTFSGFLFDSSFSLSNSGEVVGIRDSDLSDIDSVTYSSSWGGQDGSSLQKSGDEWVSATPTPGALYSALNTGDGGEGEENVAAEESSTGSSSFPVEPQIFAFAGKDMSVTVGADSLFKGKAVGLKDEPLLNARFSWNFGDGVSTEGESVLHHYRYPGTYVAVLEVSSGKYAASDRLAVKALPANVGILYASREKIELHNSADVELDLSWWILKANGASFVFPSHTILAPDTSVVFSSDVTKLSPMGVAEVALLYPNGMVVEHAAPSTVQASSGSGRQEKTAVSASRSIVGTAVADTPVAIAETSREPKSSVAAAGEAFEGIREEKSSITIWLFLLVALMAGASIGVLFLRKIKSEEITILE